VREVHRRQPPDRIIVLTEAGDVVEPALQIPAIGELYRLAVIGMDRRGLEQLQRQQREEQDAERRLGEALNGLEVRDTRLGRAVTQGR
jgi:hypothetical protein